MIHHLAIIADGNGRYGESLGLTRNDGYEYGAKAVFQAVCDLTKLPIDVETFYVFSTDNNKRNHEEVSNIFHVIAYFLKNKIYPFARENGITVRLIGDVGRLPEDMQKELADAPNYETGKTVVFAINYGGDDEIVRACRKTVEQGEMITVGSIKNNLDTAGLPDPDAIVRYGGYKRLSNFLPLQSAYAELFFTDKLWPQYDISDITDVMERFQTIKRKFGK